MKKLPLVFMLCLVVLTAKPCLNYYYSIDDKGHYHYEEDVLKAFNTNFNIGLNERRLKGSLKELESTHYFMHLSDYSVKLMNLGKADVALDILKVLYEQYPTEYRLATNLGTAYELNGDNQNALKFIKRGLELNPHDHAGSEWVHVKILEAKIKMADEPDYLDANSLLDLNAEQKANADVARQINIQARERFPFSPGPNKIMVALLTEMADCYAESISVEYAIASYRIARDYYGGAAEKLNPRTEELKKHKANYQGKEVPKKYQESGEGMHEQVGGISVAQLLDNNNKEDLKPNWQTINTNVKELLALVDIDIASKEIRAAENESSRFIPDETRGNDKEVADSDTEQTISQPDGETKRVIEEKSDRNYWLIGGLAGFFSVLIFAFVKRKKKS